MIAALRRPENSTGNIADAVDAAQRVVRNHRLWETYLITHADIAPLHVDRNANWIVELKLGSTFNIDLSPDSDAIRRVAHNEKAREQWQIFPVGVQVPPPAT